ncbi:MAG: UDP-glucose 6-dehydrogenase, partial [Bacteroidales bacterium]|nr:UDP-glucose 6-dehydrogenase [Bacteroidales bacterium]
IDNNTDKIRGLKNGSIPIYEPGLETMISRNIERERKGRKGLGDQNNYVFKKII